MERGADRCGISLQGNLFAKEFITLGQKVTYYD